MHRAIIYPNKQSIIWLFMVIWFTNMNSPIGKNVRLRVSALNNGIGEGDVGCRRYSVEYFVRHFIYGLPRQVSAWSKCACEATALREGLLWLGSYTTLRYRKKYLLPLFTRPIFRIIDWCCTFYRYFHYFFNSYFSMLIYTFVRTK